MEMKKLRPCIKCGNKDIKIWDYSYINFDIGGAKCKCGNEVIEEYSFLFPTDVIRLWNKENPTPEKYIEEIEKNIEKVKKNIISKRKEIRDIKKRYKL